MKKILSSILIFLSICLPVSANYDSPPTANEVSTDVRNFNGALSSADTDAQKAFDTLDNAIGGFVPYTGATGDLDLGSNAFIGFAIALNNNAIIYSPATKTLQFSDFTGGQVLNLNYSAIASTDKTWTFPNASDTFVGKATTDTLTNKTLTNAIVGTQSQNDNSTKAASTAYVDTAVTNAIAAVNPAVAVQAATTSAANTSGLTYSNGVSGIGATLTGVANTALTIDGYTFTATGQRLLVKNDTQSPSGARNGVYYVTQIQTAIVPIILTRALDYDMPSDMNNTGAIPVVNGTANAATSWVQTSQVTTVGTDPVTFTQFSYAPSTIVTTSTSAGGDLTGTYPNPTVKSSVSLSGNPTTTTQTALDNSTKIATTAYVESAVLVGMPIGTVVPYAGFSAPNSSWVICNGQELSRTTYASFKTAMTFTKTVNTTNASATISSVADTTNLFAGIPVEGTGVPASVTTTANITAASSIMTVTSATGLAVGMWIRDTAGNLPTGTYIKAIAGTSVTMGRWQPTIKSSSALAQPSYTGNSLFSQKTANGNSYTFSTAITSTITLNTSFAMSNNAGSSNTGITMTFFPYGNGDGSTTLNVPDLRIKMVLGAGLNGSGVGGGNLSPVSGQYSTNVPAGLPNDFFLDNSGDALGAFNVLDMAGEDNGLQLGTFSKLPSFVSMNYIIKVQ